MDATQKIAAGLDAVATTPTATNLSKLAGGVKSLSELITAAMNVSVNADSYSKYIGGLKEAESIYRVRVTNEVNAYRGMEPDQKAKVIRDEIAHQRNVIRRNTSDERHARLASIKAAADSVTAVKELFRSPTVMLARVQLGTPARNAMQASMAHSGVAELEGFAALAR